MSFNNMVQIPQSKILAFILDPIERVLVLATMTKLPTRSGDWQSTPDLEIHFLKIYRLITWLVQRNPSQSIQKKTVDIIEYNPLTK